MSMVRTTVYLDNEVALALRQLAASQGRPQAELIREALASYTKNSTRPLPAGMGKFRSGRTDISSRAKDILRKTITKTGWH
jgi:predicted transcriptional regulator